MFSLNERIFFSFKKNVTSKYQLGKIGITHFEIFQAGV